MKSLWTVWAEYGGTGEGQTLLVWIGYASGEAEARDGFSQRFGHFFGRVSSAAEGVVRNVVTEHLVPQATFDLLSRSAGRAHLEHYAHIHINSA